MTAKDQFRIASIAKTYLATIVLQLESDLCDITRIDASAVWAAGALTATVGDVATFFRALLGGRVLPAHQLAEMKQFRDLGDGSGYGLGLMRQQYPCAVVLGHTGGGLGFSTDSAQTVDGARQAVVFVNTEAIPKPRTTGSRARRSSPSVVRRFPPREPHRPARLRD